MSEQAAMPDAETVRAWWEDLLNGVRSRGEVHALAAGWLEGEEAVDDPLADYGLFDLHGADLTRPDGKWQHSMEDLAHRYEKFAVAVRLRNEDPEGYQAAQDERRRQLQVEAERAAGTRPPRERKPLSQAPDDAPSP